MSVPIRKPLSRKFNNSCLLPSADEIMAGLLTCFMLFYLPIFTELVSASTVVSKKITSSEKRCQTKFGINLQLREQLQIFTGFPFNRQGHHDFVKPKFDANVGILFSRK